LFFDHFHHFSNGLSLCPGPFLLALANDSGACAHVNLPKKKFQMVIGDFTAGELPIPANTEYGEGSLKVIERQGHVHPPRVMEELHLLVTMLKPTLVEGPWN